MAVLEKQPKRWTYEEYAHLTDDQRYEVIEGNLLMSPAPDTWHQTWIGELFFIFQAHLKRERLGKVFVAPLDVVLSTEDVVQPDLVFISNAQLGIIQPRGIFGTPELLVELVSPASVRRDRYDKKELYRRFGVKEYWIGDPGNRTLEILVLEDNQYRLHCCAAQTGKLSSLVIPGLELDLAQIQ